MRVLVTGYQGFIGPSVMRLLAEAGHEPVGKDIGYFQHTPAAQRWDVRTATIDDVRGFDGIIDLAALSNDPIGELDKELTLEINGRATVRLAELAKDAGVHRFAFASSCSVYGAAEGDDVTEDAPLKPVTAYAESKAIAEEGLAKLASREFVTVALRNATAYGASPNMRSDLVVNNLVGYALTEGEVRITGDGTPWRPLVHQEDIARAAIAALDAPADAVSGKAFNVGVPGENYQVKDLGEIVGQATGCPVSIGSTSPDARSYRVNFDAYYRAAPSFVPVWRVRAGVAQVRDFYASIGLTAEAFKGPKYVRLARIRELMSVGRISADLRWL